ncbi:hypothetical protein R9X47_24270 [Wukongibacter baidiensis]|uniref:hypothetical protein n=1 Tax=Wukongibacter baidiensis TaxID=1723361 RepID=UPI003D7F6B1A
MIREFCPKCNSLTDMKMTQSERSEKDSEGNNLTITTNSYHCVLCHTFVRSEDMKDIDAN